MSPPDRSRDMTARCNARGRPAVRLLVGRRGRWLSVVVQRAGPRLGELIVYDRFDELRKSVGGALLALAVLAEGAAALPLDVRSILGTGLMVTLGAVLLRRGSRRA